MIRVSHEMPLYMLQNGDEAWYNDYGYALVHLFEINSEYYNYYVETLKSGRTVYLDNSIFELDKAFDSNRFVYWLNKLSKDSNSTNIVYIIPDVLDNAQATIDNARAFIEIYSSLPGKSMGVMQGNTFQELTACYDAFKILGIAYCGVSFNCKAYDWFLPSIENKLERWKQARQSFVEFLYIHDSSYMKKRLHLLGCALPDEFRYYTSHSYLESLIVSIDTSNPIVHGLLDIPYKYPYGLHKKESIKLCDLLNVGYDYTKHRTVLYNIEEFKRINNL